MKKCSICGRDTITKCPTCGTDIRGGLCVDRTETYEDEYENYYSKPVHDCLTSNENYQLPLYCRECGNPFPWTESLISKVSSALSSIKDLDQNQVAYLMELLPDLVIDNNKTQEAANQLHYFLINSKETIAEGIKGIIIDVIAESVKRILFP
ncbi:DUF2321 domain-containing protein [Mitsuokella multacida]|uniref:DUF2321 domain-containing protein n=1 Tax=Mitsuokella multacida TaxID=52226 RepID=UPI0022DF05D7|nr:DUF2321 domain-containing protein [Mitsuokella multacida]